MSDVNISVFDQTTELTVTENEVTIVLSCCSSSGGGAITPQDVFDALNTLDEYPNMETAVADGLGLHDLYWASTATDSLIAGGLYRVTSV